MHETVCQKIESSVLCWLATSSIDHHPNVSPKEIFTHYNNDSIIIANIASPGSAKNINQNPYACVSFIDIFTQKGFKIAGRAMVLHPDDDGYQEMETLLIKMTAGKFPFQSIFRIMCDQVRPIIAPRYRLFPETTEHDQIRSAMETYGVRSTQEPPEG